MKVFFGIFSLLSVLAIIRVGMSGEQYPEPNAIYDGVNLLVITDYEHARNLVCEWPVKTAGNDAEILRLGTRYNMPIAFFNRSDDHLGFVVGKRTSPWSVGFKYTETPPKGKVLLVMWEPSSVK